MAEKNYTSAIALGLISVSLVVMASIVPVHGGGFIVLASFFCCGFIGQILVVNGIMQVTPANRVQRITQEEYRRNYENIPYQSIIAKINSSGVTVNTVEDAIKTYSSLFNVGEKAARPFFQNQFVKSTLGLDIQNSVQTSQVGSTRKNKTKKLDANFWDNVSEGVAKNETKSEEICADPNCSKPVSAFDFRCFKCRSRFCADCESGKSIMCKSCS
ncbi:MAG TPA: hypothetical protein D7H99_00080 [Candidatus Poseidoniales archaeon]|nr:MAG TPA: hypothetical protein D7H99_00080 [Candidatus Poseidoniales archaeon]HII57326.1 hypothetical protein [Candidatus Poseidoniaceae archaeon]|tara:strand:+ start:405 stop:1049 length:645 start_codon:yes stop_codon:yes gene_type:complete